MPKFWKTCAEHASKLWVDSGVNVHIIHTTAHSQHLAIHSRTMPSTVFPGSCTQIVHNPAGKLTEVLERFPTASTPPITTSTINI